MRTTTILVLVIGMFLAVFFQSIMLKDVVYAMCEGPSHYDPCEKLGLLLLGAFPVVASLSIGFVIGKQERNVQPEKGEA